MADIKKIATLAANMKPASRKQAFETVLDIIVSRLNSIADEFAAEIEALRAEVERLNGHQTISLTSHSPFTST